MTESFAELFEESLKDLDVARGSIIKGTVVAIDSDWVTVNAGLKSEGIIARGEFISETGELEIAEGDEVEVAVDAIDDGMGFTRLSREKAKRAEVWGELEVAFDKDEIVKGQISGKVKGGFTVDIGPIRAFLPGSLVDIRPVRDVTHLEGKDLDFKVIKLDPKRNNVVVSRRAVMEAEHSAEREALLESLQEGMVVKGIVKNLTDYGAFVDLGGIDGLLHITDMAWKRIKHPSEIVEVGQEIEIKVLKFDPETGVAFKLDLEQEEAEIEGWVDGIIGNFVTIETEHGRILTVEVDDNIRIELADDSLGTLADIVDGLKIEADFDPSSLAAFKIEIEQDEEDEEEDGDEKADDDDEEDDKEDWRS